MNWRKVMNNAMNIDKAVSFCYDRGGCAFFKYIRVNGKYRFCDATDSSMSHFGMLQENEVPQSAGMVKIRDGKIRVYGSSMILRLGTAPGDEAALALLFGCRIMGDYSMFGSI